MDGSIKMSTSTSLKSMSAPLYNISPWDDMKAPIIVSSASGSNPPTFTRLYRNGVSQGVFAYAFGSSATIEREVYYNIQIPHTYKQGTDLRPHMHFTVNVATAGTTKWGLEYTMSNIGGTFTTVTTIVSATAVIAAGSQNQHMILTFPTISGVGLTISAIILCRLFRYSTGGGDAYSADVFLLDFDMHYQSDTAGSRTETVK